MTQPALHAIPRGRDVLREQIRALALALRLLALGAAVAAGVATLFIAGQYLESRRPIGFWPELSMLPGIAGFLLPIAVWRGEARFGADFFWTLPVDRRQHALAKVCAGWVWLMAAVALFVLWLLALTLATGGNILAEETVRLLPSPTVPPAGAIGPAALRSVRWTPTPLLWLVPFTAATGSYLLASALALGARHPLRWIVGTVLGFFLMLGVAEATSSRWLLQAPVRVLDPLMNGRYGLDALLTARTESLHTEVTLSTRETVTVWRALPDLAHWAAATLLWTGAGLLALWTAASRHGELRRG
jgi:hypothetical protein